MQFFQPDLYVRFASDDDAVADAANEEWEAALKAYADHLTRLREDDEIPRHVVDFAGHNFHDAVLEAMNPIGRGRPRTRRTDDEEFVRTQRATTQVVNIALMRDQRIWLLTYSLWDVATSHLPVPEWPKRGFPTVWLYDEVDVIWERFGQFIHRVLLSNGTVLELPFRSVNVFTFSLSANEASSRS